MSRLARIFAAFVALLVAAPATAQPVDGKVEQVLNNTLAVQLSRNGYEIAGPVSQATQLAFSQAIAAAAAAGNNGNAAGATWQSVIKALPDIVYPTQLGRAGEKYTYVGATPVEGYSCLNLSPAWEKPAWYCSNYSFNPGGGSGGGGGAGGIYDDELNCDDVKLGLGVDGSLVFPSFNLQVGGAMVPGSTTIFHDANKTADSAGAIVRRVVHLINMGRDPRDWWGVVGPHPSAVNCYTFATVARAHSSGYVIARDEGNWCGAGSLYTSTTSSQSHPFTHNPCPPAEGGDFHFYGESPGWTLGHVHTCVAFFPNIDSGQGGYAINKLTSIPWTGEGAINRLPPHIKKCGLDPAIIAALTNALLKKAAATPGYSGAPATPTLPSDARPGDSTVGDLADQPTVGTRPTAPNNGVNDPPPTPPTTPPGTGGGTDTCDFGPTGCTDPGTGAPTLDDPPTSIMDPIFNWLPDLPSITLTNAAQSCPVWNINLTSMFGPDGQWLIDGHCSLIEADTGHGSVASILGVVMLACWGMAAAVIILRA